MYIGNIDKLNLTKDLEICSAKDPIKRMKRQDTDWEKISANHLSNREGISRVYKELPNPTVKTQTIQLEKQHEQTLHQRQVASKRVHRCSVSLAIWEMPIKTTVGHHLHLPEWLT